MIKMNIFTKQKQTHRLKRTKLWLPGRVREWGGKTVREFGIHMFILLCLKWITN